MYLREGSGGEMMNDPVIGRLTFDSFTGVKGWMGWAEMTIAVVIFLIQSEILFSVLVATKFCRV